MKQPCLRVKACHLRVVANLDLSSETDEVIQGTSLSRARIRCSENSEWSAALAERGESAAENPKTVPAEKCADQVDTVGGGKLTSENMTQVRLAASVHQEVAGGEGDRGAFRTCIHRQTREAIQDAQQLFRRGRNSVQGLTESWFSGKEVDNSIRNVGLVGKPVFSRTGSQNTPKDLVEVSKEKKV